MTKGSYRDPYLGRPKPNNNNMIIPTPGDKGENLLSSIDWSLWRPDFQIWIHSCCRDMNQHLSPAPAETQICELPDTSGIHLGM
jgi:hypothetical protein